jgi:hypothetical protein
MLAALESAGRAEAADLAGLLATAGERGPGAPADLARGARHLAEPLARLYPEAIAETSADGRATLRSPWPRTGFDLLGFPEGSAGPVHLELTARLPPIPGAEGRRRGTAVVHLDGRRLGAIRLTERWHRETIPVPPRLLTPGLHHLDLAWPDPPPVGEAALEAARRRLERGLEADLHPLFGEIFSLKLGRE